MTVITREDYENPSDALHTEDISVLGLNPLSICMQGSRQAMHLSQIGQMPPLVKTERAMVYHGVTDVKNIAIRTQVPYDSEIVAISGDIILFKTIDDKLLFHIKIPKWVGNHSRFGYRPVVDKDLYIGQFIKKDTIIAKPPTLDGDYFNTGTHLNVLVATYPGNAEDGCILSEAARSKLTYDTVSEISFDIEHDVIPINFWGTDEVHMGLPKVGDIIGPDNTLCVLRQVNGIARPGMLSPKALRKTQMGDKIIQATDITNAEVLEIKVISNNYNESYLYGNYCQQLDNIVDTETRKEKVIVDTVERIIRENKRKGLETKEDASLVNFIVNFKMIQSSRVPRERVKLTYRTKPASPYTVTVKLLKRGVKPVRGSKLTDRSSAKITVTSIWPEENMPEGVDIIVGPEGGVNRTIPSRGLEQWINAGAVNVGKRIRSYFGLTRIASDYVVPADVKDTLDNYDKAAKVAAKTINEVREIVASRPDDIQRALKDIEIWSDCTNHHIKEVINEVTNPDDIVSYVTDIIFHNMVTPLPTTYLTKHPAWKMCLKIHKSCFAPKRMKLAAKNFDGSPIDFKYEHFVGPVYYSVLDKTPMDISASASQILQVQGLPATRSHKDKFTYPVSRHPSRMLGVDETQIFACALGGANKVNLEFLELFDRLISRSTQEAEIIKMLESDVPSGHLTLVDRSKVPYGHGRSLQILNHMMKTHGTSLKMK